uniref:Ephrin RBD domain-containing protein n=1 Tax=Rhabditophanes sp. KR3021 TaxID=114890 RepID=A0AC35TJD4_9BILA
MHMFSAHSLIPDCLRSKSTYAGNNLWVIPTFGDDFRNINADTKERYKREAINIVSKICDKQKKIISAWPVSTPERRRNFLRDLVGSDNIDGEIKNGVVYIYSCTVIDPSDIIRSKKINDVCYDQVPVRVENKIYFSKNGIDLSTQSNVVSCPGTISWFPQLFQDKSLNILAISLFVILTIWAIGIFITLVVCYGRKSPKNNGLNDTKNISVISHQDGRSETVNFVPTYMLIDPSVTKIASYTENGNNYEIDFDTSTLQSLHSNRMTNLEELKFIRPPPPRLPQPFQGLRRNDGMSSEASYI